VVLPHLFPHIRAVQDHAVDFVGRMEDEFDADPPQKLADMKYRGLRIMDEDSVDNGQGYWMRLGAILYDGNYHEIVIAEFNTTVVLVPEEPDEQPTV
jgi:hypothetical protein